jgi:hypothetical protein
MERWFRSSGSAKRFRRSRDRVAPGLLSAVAARLRASLAPAGHRRYDPAERGACRIAPWCRWSTRTATSWRESGCPTWPYRWPPTPAGVCGPRHTGPRDAGRLDGSYLEFARTPEQRVAGSDPRPSVIERYPSRPDYLSRIVRHALDLQQGGYLLADDALELIRTAAERDLWAE